MTIRHRLARLESRQKLAVEPEALSHFEIARLIAFGLACAVHNPTSVNAAAPRDHERLQILPIGKAKCNRPPVAIRRDLVTLNVAANNEPAQRISGQRPR